MVDSLELMLRHQSELMELLEVGAEMPPLQNPHSLGAVLGIIDEGTEVMQELVKIVKPWNEELSEEKKLDNAKEELIDVLFFLLEAFILFGMDSTEILEFYKAKAEINIERAITKKKTNAKISKSKRPKSG